MEKIFTIIIPVYNVEKYIAQCLDSVVNQTFRNFEAIVVDDCSQDKSIEIAQAYAKKDNRIKILHHSKNRGLSAARNTALDAAEGEYIVCLDSDDWLENDCLEILYKEFQIQKTNSIWFDAYKFDEASGERRDRPVLSNKRGYLEITPQNICHCSDYSWIKAYKTSSIKDNNLYWPEGLTFEDGEFYFEYFMLNPNTYIIENRLYNYRKREGSIVQNARAGNAKIEDIFQVVKNVKAFCVEHGFYEKYKGALLELLNMRITTCRNIPNNYQKALKLSKEIMEEFNCPEDFKEFEHDNCPVFSIIVPIYNVEKYIQKCLKSILGQSFWDFEILCVDDCGSDNSMNIVKEFAKADYRIKIIKHKKNKGLGAARNTGLKAAKGEYVVCVDSDDWMECNCLAEVLDKFNRFGVDAVWYKFNYWLENEKRMTGMSGFPVLLNTEEGILNLNGDNIFSYPMYAWNKAFRRSFLIENKILWPENLLFEDMEFGFIAGLKSQEVYLIDKPLYVYRRRSDSIIGNCVRDAEKAKHVYMAASRVYAYIKKNGLIPEYKNSFLFYCYDNINMFRGFPKIRKELLPSMKEFIDKLDLENEIWR